MTVTGKRIGWLDSAGMPARIHRTENGGQTTVCGHFPAHAHSIGRWVITCEVPHKIKGTSRYCKVCFKDGGKTLPWVEEAPAYDPEKGKSPYYGDPKKPVLAGHELDALAGTLVNTRQNVYTVCSRLYNVQPDDEMFDRLREHGVFKCEECDVWKPISDEDKSLHDLCVSCVERINGEMHS